MNGVLDRDLNVDLDIDDSSAPDSLVVPTGGGGFEALWRRPKFKDVEFKVTELTRRGLVGFVRRSRRSRRFGFVVQLPSAGGGPVDWTRRSMGQTPPAQAPFEATDPRAEVSR